MFSNHLCYIIIPKIFQNDLNMTIILNSLLERKKYIFKLGKSPPFERLMLYNLPTRISFSVVLYQTKLDNTNLVDL